MREPQPYYVYILASRRNGTLYIGVTNDLQRRVWQHKHGLIPGFTKKYGVKLLVYYEMFTDIGEVIHRETRLKKYKRDIRSYVACLRPCVLGRISSRLLVSAMRIRILKKYEGGRGKQYKDTQLEFAHKARVKCSPNRENKDHCNECEPKQQSHCHLEISDQQFEKRLHPRVTNVSITFFSPEWSKLTVSLLPSTPATRP